MRKVAAFFLMIFGTGIWVGIGTSTVYKNTLSKTVVSQQSPQSSPSSQSEGFGQIIANIPDLVSGDNPSPTSTPQQPVRSAPKNTASQNTTPQVSSGLPKNIKIPKMGVNASFEYVGLDSAGRMDVPKQWTTVGWYKLGYRIGDNGSAVVTGHLDTSTGAPAVFWSLGKLSAGDEITVTDTQNKIYKFRVYETQFYPWDGFPLQRVFGTAGKPGLNLITCTGTWSKNTSNYSQRVVVYSELVQ